jgi:hypothetical protein
MFKLKNIIEGGIESIIGLAIIVIALITVLTGKADWTQAGVGIALGIGLLPFKLKKGGGEVSVFIFCMSMLALASCAKKVVSSKTVSDSTIITYVPVHDTISIEGEIIKDSFQLPCPEIFNKTYEIKGKRAKAKLKIDNKGKATFECDVAPYLDVITRYTREVFTLRKENELLLENCKCEVPWYYKWALGLSVFIAVFLTGRFLLSYLKFI